ncbi:MFS general substrate transporter [Laetiporus sulphureus 93-53]|uniref:MFS general substrate transporter n=1 Tax=Laetiporus sulphureus 93-53 TaxID=1314785 RepID=A0A165FUT4_9APHY|nr:MFS general substrate transporter [Laetiporus sulphureus 93-53]KZT09439.1 MFS general substrate transporter [Laetiporus sulphureus 93-53]
MFRCSTSRSALHRIAAALHPTTRDEPTLHEKKSPYHEESSPCTGDDNHQPAPFRCAQEQFDSGASTPTVTDHGTPKLDTASIDIPDGGLDAWLTVVGGWLFTFCTFGYASSFGVYQDYYKATGKNSSSDISWIGSLQLAFMFFTGLPAGQLFDMGYFRYTSIIGTLLYSFCIFMLSLADTNRYYELVLSQGIGMGLGGGLLLVPALSVQAHHWRKRRAFAMGIALTGECTSVGGIIYPIMLNKLFYSSVGYAWGVRASAFLTLGLLTIANFITKTRLPSAKDRPKQHVSFKLLKELGGDVPYMLAVGGAFLVLWGLFFPYFYLQVWGNSHGLSKTLDFYTLAILNAASIFGRTIPNLLADIFGIFNLGVPFAFISSALIFAMFGMKSNGAEIAFSILYGFWSGGYIALFPPMMAGFSRNMEEVGCVIGVAYFLCAFALLTGTPITGALLGPSDHWAKPIVFSGVRASCMLHKVMYLSLCCRLYASQAHAYCSSLDICWQSARIPGVYESLVR